MNLDIELIRSKFPALAQSRLFFDNPAGSQIVQTAIDRMNDYLVNSNSNRGGTFKNSRESDQILDMGRARSADFLNAERSEEIIFGPNMTSLNFQLARSLAEKLNKGDNLLVTRMDHDSNIAPWLSIAQEQDCNILWVDFDVEQGTLDRSSWETALEKKPKIAAFGMASNALGTISPVKQMINEARQVGAITVVDAVQYAPHGPIDVTDLNCDFLTCSAYKFFGPHIGIMFGRYEQLADLKAYRIRPTSDKPPGKFETGTQNHEGIAGLLGTFEYLEWLGSTYGREFKEEYRADFSGHKLDLKLAMRSIWESEQVLTQSLLKTLGSISSIQLYGLKSQSEMWRHVPTFTLDASGWEPMNVAKALAEREINVWSGGFHALSTMERMQLDYDKGMVRVGAVHYNTINEIEQLGEAISDIVT